MKHHNNQPSASNDEAYLEFRVGPLHFCAPALDVVGIISPPEMIHVPVSEDLLVSCFSHHNETVTVLSMHNKFGLPLTRSENKTHIILAYVDDGLKGFWVDQAMDLVQLDSFGISADYFPGEGKAYSNFLTREEEIILQTSFQRLYQCGKSSLIWIQGADANEAAEDDESTTTEITGVGTEGKNYNSDKDLKAEAEKIEPLSESVDIENEPAGNGPVEDEPAVKQLASSSGEFKKNPLSPSSPTAAKAIAYTRYRNVSCSIPSAPEPIERLEPVQAHAYMYNRDKGLKKEAEKHEPPSESVNIENEPAVKQPASSSNEFRKNPLSPGAPAAARARAFTDNRNASHSIPYVPEPTERLEPVHAHAYMHSSTSENKPEIKRADKDNDTVIIAVALLLLLAVTLGGVFWLDSDSGSAISRPEKLPDRRDSKPKEVQIVSAPDTEKLIEQAPPVIETPQNQSQNEVAQEDAAIIQPSGSARFFELRINEQQDTNLHAISSFEPVAQQQENEPVSNEQIFTHVVVKGDTLWHITRRYLDDPNRYPELAAASHIDNPHRIYPGDVIRVIVSR